MVHVGSNEGERGNNPPRTLAEFRFLHSGDWPAYRALASARWRLLRRRVKELKPALYYIFLTTIFLVVYIASAPNNQHQSDERRHRTVQEPNHSSEGVTSNDPNERLADYTFWLTAFTAALACFSLMEFWVLLRTESAMRKSIDVARQQAKLLGLQTDIIDKQHQIGRLDFFAEHRPWIPDRIRAGSPLTFNTNGLGLTVTFDLQNTGKSPALRVFPDIRLVARGEIGDVQVEIANRARNPTQYVGVTLFPSPSAVSFNVGLGMSVEQIQTAIFGPPSAGLLDLYIVGSIIYWDSNNIVHETGIVAQLLRTSNEDSPYQRMISTGGGDVPIDQIVLQRDFLIEAPIT